MVAIYKVSCLDVFASSVQKAIREVAPALYEIRFAQSYASDEHMELIGDADFLLVGGVPLTATMIEHAKRVRLIQKWGIGVDKIDLEAARRAGIPVAITSGANSGPVAELAVALMLAVYRRIPHADRNMRAGVWLKSDMRSWCYQLDGKTIGLLGFGAIARMTAHRLRGFDANIIYHDLNRADPASERALHAKSVSFDELLERSDILSIHTPLTKTTRNMVNDAAIAKMKDGAVIINTARGGIIDERALYDALVCGKLRGAGLDSFEVEPTTRDNPLFGLDQVVVTPHAGGGVFDNVAHVAHHAFGNMGRVLAGEHLATNDVIVEVPSLSGTN
jgi:D-3-phosphoglycerate dehydrogenase